MKIDPELALDLKISKIQSESPQELIIAFAAAVGVDLEKIEDATEKKLKTLGYQVHRIRVTKDVLPLLEPSVIKSYSNQYDRFSEMMDAGNKARNKHGNEIVALGVIAAISKLRSTFKPGEKNAFFVHSLKHPDEVKELRRVYPRGFYLIGIHSPPDERLNYLISTRDIKSSDAKKLMERDRKESQKFGQRLADTYHLSDFFVALLKGDNPSQAKKHKKFLENNLSRFIEIIFSHPNRTPTFGEYAMFLAFSASLRSADLSRQVGAVVTKNREILATGANDCPRPKGGLYWQTLNSSSLQFEDEHGGRDWTRGGDSNRTALLALWRNILRMSGPEFEEILSNGQWRTTLTKKNQDNFDKAKDNLLHQLQRSLSSILGKSPIADLTEFGRVVHAEMEALLSCSRKGTSTSGATLFSTTFPCHNCAKHIVAAGIDKVVFIEPYLKSKALTMHSDSIQIGYPNPIRDSSAQRGDKVIFEPFLGVGPRRFFDLFSMSFGVGRELPRKDDATGKALSWNPNQAKPRIDMIVDSQQDREADASIRFNNLI